MRRAIRTASSSPSMANTLPTRGGTLTPLKDCKGCIEPSAAPCSRSGSKSEVSSAPLVCSTTLPRSSEPALRANSSATSPMASSGTAIRVTAAAAVLEGIPAAGLPPPINRPALFALASERAATTFTRQPVSRNLRPSALPTRPAPTMARLLVIHVRIPRGCLTTPIGMRFFEILFFGLIAFFWFTHGLRVAYGAVRLPWLRDYAPAADADCPKLSLIFAARDEQQKLPAALATLVGIDYPNLEIIAVDDRSTDATAQILDEFAALHPQLKVVHVNELPKGWLGKPHALQKGFEASTGEFLVFTDADVKFQRDALRRVVTLVRERGLDHLTLFGDVERSGFWDTVLISFFGMGFQLATDPYNVSNPNSRSYAGIGAFQLLRRAAYEASGTHRRLAMEVIDDMKLGKIVKMAGFRSGVAVAQNYVSVAWHLGLGNLVRGVEKNFFAAAGFSVGMVALQIVSLLLFNVAPFFGLAFGGGWIRALAAISVLIAMCFHLGVDVVMRISPLYCLTLP